MRRDFAKMLLTEMRKDRGKNIILITADMGYGLWDDIRKEFFDRFFNVGSAEQFMIGVAAGLAMEGKTPICYSITSFLLYRPFEFIRNFMEYEKLPIKLVGGGRDKDYGYLGFTHWAEEDMAIMKQFKSIISSKPPTVLDLTNEFLLFLHDEKPHYINLIK